MYSHKVSFILISTVFFCAKLSAEDGWTPQNSGTSYYLTGVSFLNETEGWIVGGGEAGPGQIILHTTDGGSTWTTQPNGSADILYDVFFGDALTGWAVGLYGTILHTTNGGATWTSQDSGDPHNLFSVYFHDANNGWVGGDWQTLLRTTNGGQTWEQRTIASYRAIGNFEFVDENTGWLTGNGGDIFHTTDGGETWTRQNSGTMQTLRGCDFVDASTGWVVGGNWGAGGGGIILHTTDGGTTWIQQSSGTTNNLVDVFFTDASTGWVVGGYPFNDESIILHTTDGGATWDVQSSGSTRGFTRVHFTDDATGWVVGSDGTILHTTTGGSSVQIPCDSIDVFAARCQRGSLVQVRVALHYSTQYAGEEVIVSIDGADYPLVLVTNGTHTRAELQATLGGGDHTVVLSAPADCFDPLIVGCDGSAGNEVWQGVGVEQIAEGKSQELPGSTALLGNYPNPFNPSTTIHYTLGEDAHVTLRVYNMLGQLVKTLVDEYQSVGYRQVIWDGTNEEGQRVASGVHVYRMTTGEFSATKRMLLIK